MLRKLVINDWIHVPSGFVLEDGGGWCVACTCLGGFLLGGRFKCGIMG